MTGTHRLHRDKFSSQPLGGSSRATITDHQNFLRGGVPWLRGNRFLGAPFPDRVRGYSLMSLTSSIQKQLVVFRGGLITEVSHTILSCSDVTSQKVWVLVKNG